MQTEQKCEIAGRDVQMPELPIDKVRHAVLRPGKQKVQIVSVAVDDGERVSIQQPEPWLKRGIEHRFEHTAIGERELALARPGLRIVNTARGNHVDYAALVSAIDDGRVAGAALDVFPTEPPDNAEAVLHHERIIVTPHLGALTAEAQERVAIDVAEQIAAILRGEPAQYAVNAPMIAAETMVIVAPYIGVVHERAFGRTADFRRDEGEDINDTRLVAGIRIWF